MKFNNKILNIFLLFFLLITCSLNVFAENANNNKMLKTGISIIDQVPDEFFGTWRVSSALISTNNYSVFKKKNIDIWTLSNKNNVIILENPFSGATASVTLNYVNNKTIRFTKKTDYDNKILTDVVEIVVNQNSFSGKNTIILDTLSDVDKSVIKTSKATYLLKGDKIAGKSIRGE